MIASPVSSADSPPAFSRGGALALVAGGFVLFLAMLYLIGSGASVGGERGAGQAHAASNGLNGYSGLVRLVEAEGYNIDRSRNRAGLETDGLLVLTPPLFVDPEELARVLNDRRYRGPTLVILSKWWANAPPPNLPAEARAKFKRGWVNLSSPETSEWPSELPTPYTFALKLNGTEKGAVPARWSGMGYGGKLPTAAALHARPTAAHGTLITDGQDRPLAFRITLGKEGKENDDGYPVTFLAEPDLANNYGLADPNRAAAAMALVDDLTYGGDIEDVTFDMTLNGFGASENLLTLAFRPPFLAATLSLLVALLIVGWRAFQRFGPAASSSDPDIAFGKRQLIANGASLIIRARRFALLRAPYAVLSARRLAERLGLARPDPEAIDAALARRLPGEESFTSRAARLEAADKPADILAAAKALDELNTKLQQGQTSTGIMTR